MGHRHASAASIYQSWSTFLYAVSARSDLRLKSPHCCCRLGRPLHMLPSTAHRLMRLFSGIDWLI